MKKNGLAAITIVVFLLSNCSKTPQKQDATDDSRIVVQVGERKLTLGDIEKKYAGTVFESAEKEYLEKKDFVEKTLNRYLLVQGGLEEGFAPQFDTSVYRRYILQELYAKHIIRKIEISDDDIENFFKKYGGEIQMGQFVVRDSALADSLYHRARNGADFLTMVTQYTTDDFYAKRGGSLGYSTYGRYEERIEEAAFSMKIGEVSPPILTRYGWHLVTLYDRIKHSEKDLKDNWNQYKDMAFQYKQKNMVAVFKEECKANYNYKIIMPTIDFLIYKADSIEASGSITADYPSSYYLSADIFSEQEKMMSLVEFDRGRVTVSDYLEVLKTYRPDAVPELKALAVLESIFEGIALPQILEDMARNEGLDTLQAFNDGIEYYKDGTIGAQMRDKIMNRLSDITEEQIQEYYDTHPDDFFSPDQVRVYAIAVKTKKEAEELLEKLKKGADFIKLAQKYSLDKKTGLMGGDLGFFTDQRFTEIYSEAQGIDQNELWGPIKMAYSAFKKITGAQKHQIKKGQIGGPIEMYGDFWVFKVIDRLQKERKKLPNARPEVINRITIKAREDALNEWLEEKKTTTQYFVDLDLVKNNLKTK